MCSVMVCVCSTPKQYNPASDFIFSGKKRTREGDGEGAGDSDGERRRKKVRVTAGIDELSQFCGVVERHCY